MNPLRYPKDGVPVALQVTARKDGFAFLVLRYKLAGEEANRLIEWQVRVVESDRAEFIRLVCEWPNRWT